MQAAWAQGGNDKQPTNEPTNGDKLVPVWEETVSWNCRAGGLVPPACSNN